MPPKVCNAAQSRNSKPQGAKRPKVYGSSARGYDLARIMQQEPLGVGEFGKTYALDDESVVKVMDATHADEVKKEVTMHKKVQTLRVQPRHGPELSCVPPIDGPKTHTVDGTKYLTFTMPRLKHFQRTRTHFNTILTLNRHLVDHGYLHNDLHQGNIMMTMDGHPIIIDLGLMRKYKAPNSDELRSCIAYAQAAALIDNCNQNTRCPTRMIRTLLEPSMEYVIDLFALSPLDDVKTMLDRVTKVGEELNHKKPLDTEVALQLLLACLSTRFKDCKEEDGYPAMCDQILVDYIYGIRNLAGGRLDLERIYEYAEDGKGLPKLPPT